LRGETDLVIIAFWFWVRGLQMAGKDQELEAISAIIGLLEPLTEIERSRVLEYVLKRLSMSAVRPEPINAEVTTIQTGRVTGEAFVQDIRTLTAEKQPRTANEMVALIAYYLSELAPDDELSKTVNVDVIKRYFKMAKFPMPRVPRMALTNAAAAGFIDNVSRGEYSLNPVGYNLVVHSLPRSGDSPPVADRIRARKRRL
jgi:hypothetical protein